MTRDYKDDCGVKLQFSTNTNDADWDSKNFIKGHRPILNLHSKIDLHFDYFWCSLPFL